MARPRRCRARWVGPRGMAQAWAHILQKDPVLFSIQPEIHKHCDALFIRVTQFAFRSKKHFLFLPFSLHFMHGAEEHRPAINPGRGRHSSGGTPTGEVHGSLRGLGLAAAIPEPGPGSLPA